MRTLSSAFLLYFFSFLWMPSVMAAGVHFPSGDARINTTAATFVWDEVPGASAYLLWLGSGRGLKDLGRYGSRVNSRFVGDLPRGESVWVSLRAQVDGRWLLIDDEERPAYQISAEPLISTGDEMNLQGSLQQFSIQLFDHSNGGEHWADITRFQVRFGTKQDPFAYGRWHWALDEGGYKNQQYFSVSGLPTDGSEIQAQVFWYGLSGERWRWHRETPTSFFAALDPVDMISPQPGETLSSSSLTLRWVAPRPISGGPPPVVRYQWWFGTESDPDAFGKTNLPTEWLNTNALELSLSVVGLPTDGSRILATRRIHDGRRWHLNSSFYLTAAPVQPVGVWGECTPVTRGGRAALLPVHQPLWGDSWLERGVWRYFYSGAKGAFKTLDNRVADHILHDGCASDTESVSVSGLQIYLPAGAKGVYLWLAADSGAAHVTQDAPDPYWITASTLAIPPDAEVANPVYIRLLDWPSNYSRTFNLFIDPVDNAKSVRISEVRIARDSDDVTDLRKLRYSADQAPHTFVALNGDPRARVTAELNQLFGPSIGGGEGIGPDIETCGLFEWVDATWEIDEGVAVIDYGLHGRAVWVNWQSATNQAIVDAINQSLDAGEASGWPHWICTRAALALVEQDWQAKAAAALAGTYDGPTLHY